MDGAMTVLRFTLDMNCLIDIDENRPSARYVRKIVDANGVDGIEVAVLAIGASERQQDHNYLQTSADYFSRLSRLGVGHLRVLLPMAIFDMTFLDGCLWADETMIAQEIRLHEVLFPDIAHSYQVHCKDRGIEAMPIDRAWRNAKCDVQAMWCHLHYKQNVFVTSDQNFLRKSPALENLGVGRILNPADAATLLS